MQVVQSKISRPISTEENIEMNEWRVGTGRLVTSEAGTSIVLAAHNMSGNTPGQRRSTGLLGNFSMLGSTKPGDSSRVPFQTALEALPALGDPSETRLWLGGGATGLLGKPNTANTDRSYALKSMFLYLGKHGLSQELLTFEWSPPLNVAAVELNCSTGKVTVQHTFKPQHFTTLEQQ